jgi:hypothetical protein
MGEVVRQAFINATGAKQSVTWRVIDPGMFVSGEDELPQRVVDEEAWVAVASKLLYAVPWKYSADVETVRQGASQQLEDAISSRNRTYDSSGAVTVFTAEARSTNA